MISGGSWGNLGPSRRSSHISAQPAECGCHVAGSVAIGLLPRWSPHPGRSFSSLAPFLQKQFLIFFLSPSMSSGLLHKHSVARQPSSLLSSWIPGNSVQANHQSVLLSGSRFSHQKHPWHLLRTFDFLAVDRDPPTLHLPLLLRVAHSAGCTYKMSNLIIALCKSIQDYWRTKNFPYYSSETPRDHLTALSVFTPVFPFSHKTHQFLFQTSSC